MTTVDALFLSSALVIFLIAAYRLRLHTHGRRKPTDIPLLVITTALGLALVVLSPVVQAGESAFIPSLGRLLSNICTLTAAFGLLHLMLYVNFPAEEVPARARKRLITLMLAVAVMTVMFFSSRPPAGTGLFAGLYRSQPTLAVYILVYTIYLTFAVTDLAAMSLRSIRYTRIWLRAGMILIALGCVMAYGYLGQKVISVVDELLTGTVAEPYCSTPFATVGCTFAVGFPPLAVLAIILGATLPALGPHLERPFRVVAGWRSYRRLRPLWESLHVALPDLAFAAPEAADPSARGEMSERLYHRVIAIRDGLLALQPYRTPEDTRSHHEQAHAAGIAPRRRAAAVEAADIRAALYRRQHDLPPATTAPVAAGPQHDDLTSEIRWLAQVSDALARGDLQPLQHADVD